MKMNTPIPARPIDAPWAVTQDVHKYGSIFDIDDFQMPPYPFQYVQNEILLPVATWHYTHNITFFKIKKLPICPGTTTGTVYYENQPIQSFVTQTFGPASLTKIGNPTIFVKQINFVNLTGHLEMQWEGNPGHNHIVVSYEYEYANSINEISHLK